MEILDNVKQWLQPVISNGNYSIINLDYNASCFGNIYVLLESRIGVNIQIVRDRNVMSCYVGLNTDPLDNWVPIEYALEYYNTSYPKLPSLLEDYLTSLCKLIIDKEQLFIKMRNHLEFKKMDKWVIKINKKRLFKEDI